MLQFKASGIPEELLLQRPTSQAAAQVAIFFITASVVVVDGVDGKIIV